MTETTPTLVAELDQLHAHYAAAINNAVEVDDLELVEQLAAGYDHDATTLVAEREGLTHLLPLRRQDTRDSAVRRLAGRVGRRVDSHTLHTFNPAPALSGRRHR